LVIVSDKHALIKDKILNTLERGGTYLNGEGMYSGSEKRVIFTVVTRREVSALQAMIKTIDPKAFMAVMETSEIIGEGFKSIEDKSE
jgi:uncharacterized membrane-anchored protein YitT (DUF2179 family)